MSQAISRSRPTLLSSDLYHPNWDQRRWVLPGRSRRETEVDVSTSTTVRNEDIAGNPHRPRGLRRNGSVFVVASSQCRSIRSSPTPRIQRRLTATLVPIWVVQATRILLFSVGLVLFAGCSDPNRIVIASKNFTEQIILGEMIAQHLENQTDLEVDRRLNLGGSFVCHQGLIAGQIDIYVEYTGTALAAILGELPSTDPDAVLARVREVYRDNFDVEWMEPLGFNNTFAILVRGVDARMLGLATISDAAAHTSDWVAGFGYEFAQREDGYPGLAETYGFRFPDTPRVMELGLTYRALADGQVDLIAGNSTDGLIDVLDLAMLDDDRLYFPPYDAVPIVRQEVLDQHPEVVEALRLLGGLISEAEMRQLNYRVDGAREDVKVVASEFLASKGL